MRLRRPVIASLTAFLLAWGTAQEAGAPAAPTTDDRPFAALVIVSHGRQSIDIMTGLTVLPDGGRVVDTQTGVEVEATVIRYVDGEYIEASGVTVSGGFGDFEAESLHIDVRDSVLTATGDLRLSRNGLQVTAGVLSYHALANVIVFDGGVRATEPAFSADRVLLDTVSGDVLLDGRYEYAGGLFTMRSPAAGGRLQLSLHQQGEEYVYAAATEVSPALLERFRAYL
jgi:hypothetical protein